MVKLTIGVPVYNGGQAFQECLELLARQTYDDFKVEIYDNCSTDGTFEHALVFAARDSRFSVTRNAENLGSFGNFKEVLSACDTEYFVWRAHDDFISADHIENLMVGLEARPDISVVVPRTKAVRVMADQCTYRILRSSSVSEPQDLAAMLHMIVYILPHWLYGVWRTKVLQVRMTEAEDLYQFDYALDFLLSFMMVLNKEVLLTNKAELVYRRILVNARVPEGDRRQTANAVAKYRKWFQRAAVRYVRHSRLTDDEKFVMRYAAKIMARHKIGVPKANTYRRLIRRVIAQVEAKQALADPAKAEPL